MMSIFASTSHVSCVQRKIATQSAAEIFTEKFEHHIYMSISIKLTVGLIDKEFIV